jgi:hypothetical protein
MPPSLMESHIAFAMSSYGVVSRRSFSEGGLIGSALPQWRAFPYSLKTAC